jgi:hypothetical protein
MDIVAWALIVMGVVIVVETIALIVVMRRRVR